MIQVEDLTKSFGNMPVLRGVNLDIPKGCLYGLIGLAATLLTRETFGPVERAAAQAEDETMRVAA